MNNLTILNPNKLLEHVADAIDKLQLELGLRFTNNTCFGPVSYTHLDVYKRQVRMCVCFMV